MQYNYAAKGSDSHKITSADRIHDHTFIEEHTKNLFDKNKQTIPLLTTTLITPSISPSHLLSLNSQDLNKNFVRASNLIRHGSKYFPSRIQNQPNFTKSTSDSLNNNYYFKNKANRSSDKLRNSNLTIQSTNSPQLKKNSNSNSQDLVHTSNTSLINSSTVMNRYQEANMAQYTKFTKNIFSDNYNSSNGAKIEKSPSRGSNFTSPMPSVINGTPISIMHSSAGQQSHNKGERLKASPSLGRSATLKYTKSYMENNNLKQPLQTHTQHFNFSNSRKPLNPQTLPQPHLSQESITKKDFINVLNNIQRSSSIKLGREKTSLSNYFTNLSNSNKLNNQSNQSVNGSMNQLSYNFMSSSNNLNSLNSQFSKMNQLNQHPKQSMLRTNNLNLNKYLDHIVDHSSNLKISASFKSNRHETQEQQSRVKLGQNLDNESDDSDQIVEYINIEDLDEKKKKISEEAKVSNTPALPASRLSQNNSKKGSNQNLKATRPISRMSHVSRDVNDSYAYSNVKQYIEENDLMPPEKADSIRRWVKQVNLCVDDWEKRTIEINIVQE